MKVLAGLLLLAAPLGAQTPVIAPTRSALFAVTAEGPGGGEVDTLPGRPPATAFQNAFSLFGAGLGTTGGWLLMSAEFRGDCPDDPLAGCPSEKLPIGWRLAGTAVSGVAGYVVARGMSGRWSRPRQPDSLAVSTRPEDRGVKWWQGAAMGTVVGGVAIVGLAKAFRWNEQGDGEPVLIFAPVGAIIGLVVGGGLAQAR